MPHGPSSEGRTPLEERPGAASLEKIFQILSDGLLVIDDRERVLLLNPTAERLLGLKQKGLFDLTTLSECIVDRKLLRRFRAAARGTEPHLEYELSGETPTVVTVEATPVPATQERLGGTAFVLHDVTRERTLDRLKNEFISTAAHELRTPLTAIMGFSELLLMDDGFTREQRHDFLTYIYQKSVNLARIIADLLDISRIQAGRGLELNRERCDLKVLVRETVEPYRRRDSNHRLELTLPEEGVELPVDPGKIIQVLENLLSNAFKYSPRGGEIEVSVLASPGGCQVTVRDQGIGMSREDAGRAFDKFYRVDSSNTAVAGTGLGLSIAKCIVEAHGGHIWLESRKGQGTVVSFLLPAPASPDAWRSPDTGHDEAPAADSFIHRAAAPSPAYAAAPPEF